MPHDYAHLQSRKGALKLSDVSNEVKTALESGAIETKTLAEVLSIDLYKLLENVTPKLSADDLAPLKTIESYPAGHKNRGGITKRMQLAGEILRPYLAANKSEGKRLAAHSSETIRGIMCYAAANTENDFPQTLVSLSAWINDTHQAVREWVWIAARPAFLVAPKAAIKHMQQAKLSEAKSPLYTRRFAIELTRPRGVWCKHCETLKQDPSIAVGFLEPAALATEKYLQDSVANWLNDASKTQPKAVIEILEKWQKKYGDKLPPRLIRRAKRSLDTS